MIKTIGILLIIGAVGYTAYNIYLDKLSSQIAEETAETLEEKIDAIKNGQNDLKTPEESTEESEERTQTTIENESSGFALWELYPEMDMPTVMIEGYQYIGILEIPSLKLKLPVMEEWDYERLNIALCRYSGSVYLDNMVICGHNYSGLFGPIRTIGIGETVRFTDADGNLFKYTVENVETLTPNQNEELLTGDWDLTLVTCNTGARTRRAVRCYRADY